MSQNGKASMSSVTRLSVLSYNTLEVPEHQRQVIDSCTSIIQDFRAGRISKPKASILLQQCIPHDDADENFFLSIYEPYFDMLNNFEHYQKGNIRGIGEVQCQLGESSMDEQNVDHGQPADEAHIARASKRPCSPASDDGDTEYEKKTHHDYGSLPWNEPEDPSRFALENLSPSLQKTHALLENFSRDVKQVHSSLLNCNLPILQFLPMEWLNLLNGNTADLDHVFSNIYTISYDTRDIVELSKDVELLHGSSAPAKTIKTHSDWVITGIASSMLCCSSSSIENKSYVPIANTSNDTSHPCHPSCIARSSITIKLFALGLPSNKTLNSPILQSLPTFRSNGSTIWPTLLPVSSQSPSLNRTQTVDEQLLVEDGTTTDVLIHPPIATTYMSALSVPIQGMLPAAAPLQTRNRVVHPNMHWEHCPGFVCDFVWSDVDSQDTTTALVSELVPPVPQSPQNKLLNKEKWDIIKSHPHLFRITTPIDVDCFGSLLVSHPNQALVKSVCKGLCSGFWPWAITKNLDMPSIVDNAVLQKVKNQGHLNFMRNQ